MGPGLLLIFLVVDLILLELNKKCCLFGGFIKIGSDCIIDY